MTTYIAWVLYISACNFGSCSPVVIDNIASQANCEALAAQISLDNHHACIAVRKVAPPEPRR